MFFFNLSRYKNNMIKLCYNRLQFAKDRSSHPKVFLGKGVLKICSKFTGEHSCRSVISIKLQINFIEIALRHGCFSVNLLHIFRKPFIKNASGRLLLLLISILSAFLKIAISIMTKVGKFSHVI